MDVEELKNKKEALKVENKIRTFAEKHLKTLLGLDDSQDIYKKSKEEIDKEIENKIDADEFIEKDKKEEEKIKTKSLYRSGKAAKESIDEASSEIVGELKNINKIKKEKFASKLEKESGPIIFGEFEFPNRYIKNKWPKLHDEVKDLVYSQASEEEPLEKRVRTVLKKYLGADNIRNKDEYKKFFHQVIKFAINLDTDKLFNRIEKGRKKYNIQAVQAGDYKSTKANLDK